MTTLLIATGNAHKVGEIRTILGEQFHYLTLKDFPAAPAAVEDAPTFAGNATKKALTLIDWLGQVPRTEFRVPHFVLADDSGLEVDALGGAPGVHSARFAALDSGAPGNAKDTDNNAKLLRLLRGVPPEKLTARFRCVIALAELTWPAAPRPPRLFDGTCEGRIRLTAHGAGGFGYDPLFMPNGFNESFAELGDAVKSRLSHRALALAKLQAALAQ
jgi:XTP/dITP diphosphohydrolase